MIIRLKVFRTETEANCMGVTTGISSIIIISPFILLSSLFLLHYIKCDSCDLYKNFITVTPSWIKIDCLVSVISVQLYTHAYIVHKIQHFHKIIALKLIHTRTHNKTTNMCIHFARLFVVVGWVAIYANVGIGLLFK